MTFSLKDRFHGGERGDFIQEGAVNYKKRGTLANVLIQIMAIEKQIWIQEYNNKFNSEPNPPRSSIQRSKAS